MAARLSISIDPDYRVEYGDFLYGGPFFVSCDHGCAHGRSHANGINCGTEEPSYSRIFEVNRQRILNADFMFAFINEIDCFGTLIELGIALQQPKLCTAVTFGPNVSIAQYKDLWMAEQCAGSVYLGSAKDTWQEFTRDRLRTYMGRTNFFTGIRLLSPERKGDDR